MKNIKQTAPKTRYNYGASHSAYTERVKRWETNLDAASEDGVKSKGEIYLKKPSSDWDADDYTHYLDRAIFFNIVSSTLDSLLGFALNKEPKLELSPEIKGMAEKMGDGSTFPQHARNAIWNLLVLGRVGLLVDYPVKVEGETRSAASKAQPKITVYPATSIVNWQEQIIDGETKLTMVSLKEARFKPDIDPFAPQTIDTRLIYMLIEGKCFFAYFDVEGGQEPAFYPVLDFRGVQLEEIPFYFVGTVNNTARIDEAEQSAPVSALVDLNISHYKSTADHEDTIWLAGQATLVISGYNPISAENPSGDAKAIKTGSRTAILLEQGGTASLLQAAGNSMAFEWMQAKVAMMAMIGAKIIQPNPALRTATEVNSENAKQYSVLSLLVKNLQDSYVKAFNMACIFQSGNYSAKNEVVFDSSYMDQGVNGDVISNVIQMYSNGLITDKEARSAGRRAGLELEEKDDEALRSIKEAEDKKNAGLRFDENV